MTASIPVFNTFSSLSDPTAFKVNSVENCRNGAAMVMFTPTDQNTISDVFMQILEPDEAKELICKFTAWRAQKENEWLAQTGSMKTKSDPPIVSGTIHPESIFCWACSTGRLTVATALLNLVEGLDAHKWNGYAFREACKEGHLKVARYLFNRVGGFNPIEKKCAAFRWAVRNGHVETACFAYSLIKDIYTKANALNPQNKRAIAKNIRDVIARAQYMVNTNEKVLVKEGKLKAINEFIGSISVW